MHFPDAAWPTSTAEEAYWRKIRKSYMIGADEIYLNTGPLAFSPGRSSRK